jgi:hypothetical protein
MALQVPCPHLPLAGKFQLVGGAPPLQTPSAQALGLLQTLHHLRLALGEPKLGCKQKSIFSGTLV